MLELLKSDEELTVEITKGNTQAFEILYQRHKKAIFQVVKKYLNNDPNVDDLNQEIWMKLIDAASTFEPKSQFKSWFTTLARNHCLNYLTKKQALQTKVSDLNKLSDNSQFIQKDTETLIEERFDESLINESIKTSLEGIPFRQKTALILKYFESMSIEQISDHFNIDLNATKALLHRGRLNFKLAYEKTKGHL